MSLFDYMFDNEWRQRADIETLKASTATSGRQARRRALRANRRIEELETEVGELTLLCRALVSVLDESGVLDADALGEAVQRIDLEDGVLDGRVTPDEKRPAAFREPPEESEAPKAPTPRRRRRR